MILLAAGVFATPKIVLPDGWQLPTRDIYHMKWRDKGKGKYLRVGGDFNADGLQDSALVLDGKMGKRFGLFVFLQQKDSTYCILKLHDTQDDKKLQQAIRNNPAQDVFSDFPKNFGIRLIAPGLYKTACGKGYYECTPEDSSEIAIKEILIKSPAIEFFHYDAGGNRYFFWDNLRNRFFYSWIDD
jgi:hypothetical protein